MKAVPRERERERVEVRRLSFWSTIEVISDDGKTTRSKTVGCLCFCLEFGGANMSRTSGWWMYVTLVLPSLVECESDVLR